MKKQKGITLIALVVTIVVLIILAGVSISVILNQDGLINKAISSGEQTKIENIKEKLEIVKGLDYIEQESNNTLDTYFTILEKEKIGPPYEITNKEKTTDNTGIIEVDNKYSFLVTIENNKNIKIEYEGQLGEIDRTIPIIEIAIEGEKLQNGLPINLTANVKSNGEIVTSGKYILNTESQKIGIEESLYTQTISETINLEINELNNYYIHTLTTDEFGRKQETLEGPITITPTYHSHVEACKKYVTVNGKGATISIGYFESGWDEAQQQCYKNFRCSYCGAYSSQAGPTQRDIPSTWSHYCSNYSTTSTKWDGTYKCNKTETTIESCQINY